MRQRLLAIVNAKYTVPTWLWNISSTALAAVVLLWSLTNPSADLDAFTSSLILNGVLWSALLVFGGILAGIGMAANIPWFVRTGAMLNFCMWIFGTIAFAGAGGVNVIIFSLPVLIYYAYLYLASFLRNYPPKL